MSERGRNLFARITLIVLGILFLLGSLAALPIGVAFTALVVDCLILFAVLARAVPGFRRWRTGLGLIYIEQATRMNLPLPAMLRAAAESEGMGLRHQMYQLSRQVELGTPLSDAMKLSLPSMSPSHIARLQTAEKVGKLPQAMARIVEQERTRSNEESPNLVYQWVYPLVILVGMFTIVSGVMVFVVPKFEKIFEDFDTELPGVTILLINMSRDFAPFMAIIGILTAMGVLVWCALRIFVTRAIDWYPGREVVDAIVIHIPLLNCAAVDRGFGEVCFAAADALDAGMPLADTLDSASYIPANRSMRARVRRWADGVRDAKSIDVAAHHAGIPLLAVWMLGTGQRVSNVPAVLRFLGRYYTNRFSRTMTVIRTATLPVVVFSVAALVGFVVLSLFLPLVKLIQSVTG